MVDILDVATPVREVETARYGKLTVKCLTLEGLVYLFRNHPEIFKMFSSDGKQQMSLDEIFKLGENVVASVLAAGLGHPGNADVIQKCKEMNPDDMWTIAEAIFEESFPKAGAANFLERILEAAKKANLVEISQDLKKAAEENQLEKQKESSQTS